MHEVVRDFLPGLDPLFADQYSAALRAEVAMVYKALGSSIRSIFIELENLVRRDPALITAATAKFMKERLRIFNNYLEEICREQSPWVAADDQVRAELWVSVLDTVLPPYMSFVGRLNGMPDAGRDKYLKHTPGDVEARINRLFQGMVKKSRLWPKTTFALFLILLLLVVTDAVARVD